MASCSGGGGGGGGGGGDLSTLTSSAGTREELKSQFCTREGVYRLITALELSRTAARAMMPPISYGSMNASSTSPNSPGNGPCPPLRLSFVNILEDDRELEKKSDEPGSPNSPNPASARESGTTALLNNDNSAAATSSLSSSSVSGPLSTNAIPPRLCFNLGKELFVYSFLGCRKVVDLMKPIDKRVYKGTFPTCHEFNPVTAREDNLSLLIGFSGGQIQLVDPISKEINKLFNEDRIIDKTRVTCIRWVPNSTNMFLVSHGSGSTYLYNSELSCGTTPPHYTSLKQGPGFTVSTCKSKALRNPILRWTLGEGATNEFAFSPCGLFLAIVSQDGFLRIFRYENHDLVGITRSYFGGLLCVCWSPDCKYVCVGGEDDLVTVWSFKERRVVARGQGHKSWVSVVAFDPYTTTYGDTDSSEECGNGGVSESYCQHNHIGGLENECQSSGVFSCDSTFGINSKQNNCVSCQQNNSHDSPPPVSGSSATTNNKYKQSQQLAVNLNHSSNSDTTSGLKNFLVNRHSRTSESMTMRLSVSESTGARIPACYRVGSVGQDTQFCLWEFSQDILKQPFGKSRPTTSTSRAPGDMSPSTNVHSTTNLCNSYQHIRSNNNSRSNPPVASTLTSNCVNSAVTASHLNCNSVAYHDKDKDVVDSVVLVNCISSSSASGVGIGSSRSNFTNATTQPEAIKKGSTSENGNNGHANNSSGHSHGILSLRFGALGFGSDKGKEHKRNFSMGSSSKLLEKNNHTGAAGSNSLKSSGGGSAELNIDDPLKLIGTQACPRLDECPLLEPLICKKISHERLTTLIFREESIVTACQDGVVCTWARPGEDFRISGYGPSRTKVSVSNSAVPDDIFNRLYQKGDPMEPL